MNPSRFLPYIFVFLADWANGLFAVLLSCQYYNIEPLWWHFAIGILLSHLPDMDAMPELLTRGKVSAAAEHGTDHREGLHYPIALLFLGVITWIWFGYWGLIILFNLALHLINDFYGVGWGVKLFWPFSNRQYKFLSRRVNRLKYSLIKDNDWQNLPQSERRLKSFVSWDSGELPGYMKQWGIDDWISIYYGRLNWISGIESALFGLAVALAFFSLFT